MAETLKLKTNVPEVIALQFADGLATSSQFGGDQVMFTLTDGRKLYVAPIVAKKISDAGIGAKQAFSICKREITSGNRRIVEYQIETASFLQNEAVSSSSVALMKMAGCGAIDVVLEVERYARDRGMVDFAFDPGSIQDLVTSLFISMEKKAGRQ